MSRLSTESAFNHSKIRCIAEMQTIIRDNRVTESKFTVVDSQADLEFSNIILPLALFLERKASLRTRSDIGVWLEADEDIELIEEFAKQLPVIALNFPAFNDGRAYSSANILRRKLGYQGEVRAIGDVRRDQLEQMIRCGFDSFALADGQDVQAALSGIKSFSYSYQPSIDRPDPLFRQRNSS